MKLFSRKPKADLTAELLKHAALENRTRSQYAIWRMNLQGSGTQLGTALTFSGAIEFATKLKAQYPYSDCIAPVWVSYINDDMTFTIKHV